MVAQKDSNNFKVLVAMPKTMLAEIDAVAKDEYRTRSDLMREALRRYIDGHKRKIAMRSVPHAMTELTPMEQ